MHQLSSNNRVHRLRCTIITCALVAACYQAMLLDALAQTLPVGNPLRVQSDSSAESIDALMVNPQEVVVLLDERTRSMSESSM